MLKGRNITALTRTATDYVTVAQIKRHLNIESDNTDHDTYLGEMLPACFDLVDSLVGYCTRKSTVEYLFDQPETSQGDYMGSTLSIGNCFHVPARVMSVSSVKYLDSNGAEQTLTAGTDYQQLNSFAGHYGADIELINEPSSLYDYGWRYKVTVVEGFEPASANPTNKSHIMPDALIHAVKLFAGQYWSERMGIVIGTIQTKMDFAQEMLLTKYKIREFI